MYNASSAYVNKILAPYKTITRRIRGKVDNISFTENDILIKSFAYAEKCVNSADINLGGVFVGQLQLSFTPAFASRITRGSWRGRKIKCSIGLLVDPAQGTWEDIPIKPYFVDEASHSKDGVTITAYDVMTKFDKACNLSQTQGKLYDLATLACTNCGVSLGMTEAQMDALCNGTSILGLYPDNDITTWRDFVSWIAVTMGGYATINRAGKLEFRAWHSTPDMELDINDRAIGGNWSDFVTYYTGVSYVDMETNTVLYYGLQADTGLTMKLGSNPLMQYGSDAAREQRARNILTALQGFVYNPFTSTGLLDPIFDLGDVIEYSDGIADGAICCIHKMEFKYASGMKLTGFGKNPALFGAQSKTDKNIAGLQSQIGDDKNKVSIITFKNAAEIDIYNSWNEVARLRIGVLQPQTILLHGIINVDLETAGTVYVRYVVNTVPLVYMHICQFPVDTNTITLFLPIDVENDRVNDIRVQIMGVEASGSIAVNDAQIALQGVGVTAGAWDGYLEIEETYAFPIQKGMDFGYTDTATVSDVSVDGETYSDSYAFGIGDGIGFGYSDAATVTMHAPVIGILTEDGESTIITETDDNNIIYD